VSPLLVLSLVAVKTYTLMRMIKERAMGSARRLAGALS
jgi:hypothetical protein